MSYIDDHHDDEMHEDFLNRQSKRRDERRKAIAWWNELSSLRKTQICDTHAEMVGVARRWETLTGREIEVLFNEVA